MNLVGERTALFCDIQKIFHIHAGGIEMGIGIWYAQIVYLLVWSSLTK